MRRTSDIDAGMSVEYWDCWCGFVLHDTPPSEFEEERTKPGGTRHRRRGPTFHGLKL
jgi:hypothetical protein